MKYSPARARRTWGIGFVISLALLASSNLAAADNAVGAYAGQFSNDSLTLKLIASADGLSGTLTRGKSTYPVKAHIAEQHLEGTFSDANGDYPFKATLDDKTLQFAAGLKTYALVRQDNDAGAATPNPLDAPDPSPAATPNASTTAPVAADLQKLGEFIVMGTTDKGKTLFLKLPASKSLESAITQTADALGKLCGTRPVIDGGFANKNKTDGGAPFTAKLDGHDIRGVILCGVSSNASTGNVVFADADAAQEDIARLFGFLPVDTRLTPHPFPDGSGSIDLPAGWTTNDPTAAFGIIVHGPQGQSVAFNVRHVVYEPNCSLVRNAQQTYQLSLSNYNSQLRNYQQGLATHQRYPNTIMPMAPRRPVPPNPDPNIQYPKIDFCPYCDGVEALIKNWYPISEAKQKRAGGIYTSIDQVIKTLPGDPNPLIPGSAAGIAYLAVTDHDGEKATRVRVLNFFGTAPIMQGELWQFSASNMCSDLIFDRDFPVMQKILNSVQLNMDVCNQKVNQVGNDIRQKIKEDTQAMVKRNQDFLKSQDEHFRRFEAQMAAQQQAMHDSSSDTIEYVLGVRDVYDSATGKMLSVDLFNSHAITGSLNAAANDPGRFVEIPLRYER